ncbi:MAG: 4-hydroxy-tetrahydrodipicolinate reductase [Nocardioidaceae bacterium]|nr:4-hydroxy-tetrahydrodipicolinate reductase [Nocardioidaceae bacterium]
MTRVAVLGAQGRMGSESVKAIRSADGLVLVAEIDIHDDLDSLEEAEVEAILDFTHPNAAMDNIRWCIDNGVNAVIGTSGFSDQKVADVRAYLGEDPKVGVLVVPNFSIGAVLMMKFAGIAAPFFESVEIIEMHHPDKIDAPSGTATRTAEIISAARDEAHAGAIPDATTSDPDGARGATVEGVHVHSVRARGFVASQEVLFGGTSETLSIRHDSTHRESFMPGVIAAMQGVSKLKGVHVGLDAVLDL